MTVILLAFVDTPHLYVVLGKPFKDERGFVFNTPETVKHKDKKDVKFFAYSRLFQDLYRVTFVCGHLIAGNAFFFFFNGNHPTHLFRKFVAGDLLHRNVVFHLVNLLFG